MCHNKSEVRPMAIAYINMYTQSMITHWHWAMALPFLFSISIYLFY